MTSAFRNSLLRIASMAAGSAALAVMAGCGMGNLAGPTAVPAAQLSGVLHGGPNPIKGAQITLWETVTAGIPHAGHGTAGTSTYGSTAQILATTTTDSYGGFNFGPTPSYTCDPGEYAYLTGTGGYTGANSPNPNSVQIVALGPCSSISTATNIYISELSTMATAYALGNFISEDASKLGTGSQLVSIGAPANNNATPGCTGSGSLMSCKAGGLGHAFTNAIGLVDAVRYNGVSPAGTANMTPMINGSPVNSSGVIPQALLGTLGNVLQSCVNTIGGVANDGSACGRLFAATTVGSSVPTDTLQAAMNIARYPANNVSTIMLLAPPIAFFTPQLSTQPADFSLAVTFDGINGTTFGKPQYVALDYADNVYTVALPTTTSSSLAALASNGSGLFASTANSTYYNQNFLAVDTHGNAWSANASTTAPAVLLYDATSGTLEQQITPSSPGFTKPNGVAVDKSGNLYFDQADNGTSLWYIPYGSITPVETTLNGALGNTIPAPGNPTALTLDASQNVWSAMSSASNVKLFYEWLQLYGPATCSAPDFCGFIGYPPGTATVYGPSYGTLFDSTGHNWTNSASTVYETKYSSGLGSFSLMNTVSLSTTDTLEYGAMDGANTIFYPDNTAGGLLSYSTTGGTKVQLAPCYAAAGAKKCAAAPAMKAPINAQVDSSGAVWFSDPSTGRLVQVLGVAAPAWPALSYAHFGVKPQ